MKTAFRFAFVAPLLLAVAFVYAKPSHSSHVATAKIEAKPIRYVTLDRMLREFAESAKTASADTSTAVLAQR